MNALVKGFRHFNNVLKLKTAKVIINTTKSIDYAFIIKELIRHWQQQCHEHVIKAYQTEEWQPAAPRNSTSQ